MSKQKDNLNNDLEKLKALENQLKKTYGANYYGITQKTEKAKTNFLLTEFNSLNYIFGEGLGFPLGKLIEIYGKPSSGKSTISYQLIAQCQKQGKLVALIDAENAYDEEYGLSLGIDPDMLAIYTPNNAENTINILREFVRSGLFSLVVIDSIAALSTQQDIDKNAEEFSMAVLPRLLSKTLADICNSAAKNQCSIIAINQTRDNISPYGSPVTTPGGNALKFQASVRMQVTKKEVLKNGLDNYAIVSELKNVKNKVAKPYLTTNVTILFKYFDKQKNCFVAGIDPVQETINLAIDLNVIVKKGSWFYFQDLKFQGLANCREHFAENQTDRTKLKTQITDGCDLDGFHHKAARSRKG